MPQTQPLSARAFLHFFPSLWWYCIVAAIALLNIAPGLEPLYYIVINFSILMLAMKLAVVIHETGHLLAAKVAGGIPKRMVLGIGHEKFRTEVGGIKVILNSIPTGGLAFAIFGDARRVKWRYALFTIGGVLANIVVGGSCFLLFGVEPEFLFGSNNVEIATPVIVTNAICLLSLLPYYTTAYGPRLATDGLTLLQLPFSSRKHIADLEDQARFFDAYEHMENREYDKAYEIYNAYSARHPHSVGPVINLSTIHLRRGEIQAAHDLLYPFDELTKSGDARHLRGYVLNNLAHIYLLQNDIDRAYEFASKAIKVMPGVDCVHGTYGAVLVEKGEIKIGMSWLFKNMDFEHPNTVTLQASNYLMLAYYLRGDIAESFVHRDYIRQHIYLLEKDDLMLFERNLSRTFVKTPESTSNPPEL